jgi:integrase
VSRKANGESSIYKDSKGRWHGWVSLGLREHGKPDRRHVSGKTRGEVVAKVRELEQKRDAGQAPVAGKSITFGEWLDHWLTIAKRTVRVQTYVGYECYVRLHIKPALGHHRLDRLQPEHLEAFYTHLADGKGLSPAMQLQQHRVISRALKIATQRGRVARNVAILVQAPTLKRSEVVPFSTDEARKILRVAAGHRNAARWSVALAMGLRQGEALGARWQDLDLDAGTWRVVQGLQRQAYRHGCGTTPCGHKPLKCPQRIGGLVFVAPKSEKGKRTIGIPSQLVAALKAHRQQQEQERTTAGSVWQDHGLVFAGITGKMIDPSRDWEEWKQILREAEVRDGRLHDARHTAATLLLEQGVDARVVMEILGHSQITLTQNTYQHVMPKVIADATERVAAVLFPTTATTTAPRPATQEAPPAASPQVGGGESELPHLDLNQKPFD